MRLRSMAWPGSGARRMTRRSSQSNSAERSSDNAIDEENSNSSADDDIRRNRPNVRRYVRSSAAKRDWTIGDIHERFVRAVDQLGGQEKATPKKILQLMEFRPEGLTLGQVKSHLQMHRKPAKEPSGLSEESTPRSDQRQSQPHRIQPQRTSVTSLQLGQPKSGLDDMAEIPLIEGAAALLQLREDSGRSADATGESALLLGSPSEHIESMQTVEKLDTSEIFSVARDEEYVQTRAHHVTEHEFHQQEDPGSSSNSQQTGRPLPSLGSFFGESSTSGTSSSNPAADVTKSSLSGCKRIAEEGIELELTMATRPRGPNFQFASPVTQEEADLDLALA